MPINLVHFVLKQNIESNCSTGRPQSWQTTFSNRNHHQVLLIDNYFDSRAAEMIGQNI